VKLLLTTLVSALLFTSNPVSLTAQDTPEDWPMSNESRSEYDQAQSSDIREIPFFEPRWAGNNHIFVYDEGDDSAIVDEDAEGDDSTGPDEDDYDVYCIACLGDDWFADSQTYLGAIQDISIIEADYINSSRLEQDTKGMAAALCYIRTYENYYHLKEIDRWQPEDIDVFYFSPWRIVQLIQ
jgi:hypothetical protein